MASEELNHLFLVLTGQAMPDLDPTLMREHLVLPQRELEQQLVQLQELLVRVAQSVSAESNGDFSEAYYEAMLTLASPEGKALLEGLRDAAKQLGDFAEESAYQAEYTILMILLQLGLFLVEFAVTFVMAIWNPWGAMIRQAYLRALYRNILNSLMFRLTSAIASQQVLQIGLAAAMDRLAQWSLAKQGKVSANGDAYLKQSVIFGSIAGFVAVPVQFGASALAQNVIKRMHKGAGDRLLKNLSDALANRPDLKNLKTLASDTTDDVADDVADNASDKGVGGTPRLVPRPENNVGGFTGDGLPPLGGGAIGGPDRVFARDFADRITDVANRISRDQDPLGTNRPFVSDMGDIFARRFGDDMGGEDSARALGRDWADTFLGNIHQGTLGGSLRSVLDGRLPASFGDDVLRAMSTSVQDLFGTKNFGSRFVNFTLHAVGDGIIGLGSEMVFNGITQKTFSVSGGGFLTSITSERAASIFNSGAEWLARKFKPANLDIEVNKIPLVSDPSTYPGTGASPASTDPHTGDGDDIGTVRPGVVNTVGGGGPSGGVSTTTTGVGSGAPTMPTMPTVDDLLISSQPVDIPDWPVLIPQAFTPPLIDAGPSAAPDPVTGIGGSERPSLWPTASGRDTDVTSRGTGPGDPPNRDTPYDAQPLTSASPTPYRSGDLPGTTPGEGGRDIPGPGGRPPLTSPASWNPAVAAATPIDVPSPTSSESTTITPPPPGAYATGGMGGPGDLRPSDLRASDLKTSDLRASDPRPTDPRTSDPRASEPRSADSRPAETRSPATGTAPHRDNSTEPHPTSTTSNGLSDPLPQDTDTDSGSGSSDDTSDSVSITSDSSLTSEDSVDSLSSAFTDSTARTDPDPDEDEDEDATRADAERAGIDEPLPLGLADRAALLKQLTDPFPHTTLTTDQLRTTVRDAIAATHAQNPAHLDEHVILLEELARLLYPHNTPEAFRQQQPHSPAQAGSGMRDDIGIGTPRTDRRLAAGPGWAPVTDWATLDRALEAAGTGSTALILTQNTTGPGHAYAAHRTADGTRWTELQARSPHQQVTQHPPAPAPRDTRAVVITPNGRVARTTTEGALTHTPDHTSYSTLTDPPPTTAYKGFGFEAELKYILRSSSALKYGDVLAVHSTGLKIVVDKDTFFLGIDGNYYDTEERALATTGTAPWPVPVFIPEVMSPTTSALPGERKNPGPNVIQTYFTTRGQLDGAHTGPADSRLDRLLSTDSRWVIQPAGNSVTVAPTSAGPGHAAYAQFTAEVPLAGLTPMPDLTRLRLESPPIGGVSGPPRPPVTGQPSRGPLGPGHESPFPQQHTPADPPTPDTPPADGDDGTDQGSRRLADNVFDTLVVSGRETDRPSAEPHTHAGPRGTGAHDQRFPLDLLRNEVNLRLPRLGWTRGAVDEATVQRVLRKVHGPVAGVNLRDLAEQIAGRITAGRTVRMRGGATGSGHDPRRSADEAGHAGDPTPQDTAAQQAGPSRLTRRTPGPDEDSAPAGVTATEERRTTPTPQPEGPGRGTVSGTVGETDDNAPAPAPTLVPAPAPAPVPVPAHQAEPAEQFYSREIARHLESEPIDTRGLLALLQRWSSSPQLLDSGTLQTAYRDLTGAELATDLNRAVEQGRLNLVDLPAVSRRLGLSTDTRPAEEALPHMAARSPADEPALPAVVEYTEEVHLAYQEDNPQSALSLLDALDRDLRKVWTVEAAWRRQHGNFMGPALMAKWPTYGFRIADALGFADRAAVPVAQVGQWYRQLADLTFEHYRHGTVPVTTGHPEDGCFYRSHLWALQLMRWGVMPQKVYAARASGTKLTVTTHTALNATRDAPGQVSWRFHVAPVVHAAVVGGRTVPFVLDPTLQRGLLTIPQWMQALGLSSQPGTYRFYQGPLTQVHHQLAVDRQQRPGAWSTDGATLPLDPTLLLTDAHAHSFPYPTTPPITSWQESNSRVLENSNRLYRHHVRAERRELARTLDRILAAAPAGHPSGQLLEQLRAEVERRGPMPGFLQERSEFDAEARRLLAPTDYDRFASLFPPPDPAAPTVEESSDGETSEEEPDPDDQSSHEDSSDSDREGGDEDRDGDGDGNGDGNEERGAPSGGEPSPPGR
ncbi:protein-glutamine glutaminase family protein [Streptomyces sp. NPDC004610]|uniref:protein-glutamine glutaminase family protein n=1 Tax=unclassified Streptomyces TaxID=2593676 RepID=UPI0033A606E1